MAAKSPTPADIQIEKLLLDEGNPRFAKPLPQDEMLAKLAAASQTVKLATHITAHGLNPLERLAVVPSAEKSGRFVTAEGNRRLAALKLLTNPHLAGTEKAIGRFRQLAKEAVVPVPTRVPCIVFQAADAAREWIIVKHVGELEGAGTVRWDAIQRGRFNLRSGRPEQYAAAYQFLDEAVANDWIAEDDANSVNVSSLARVLKDKGVQRVLHGETTEDGVAFNLADDGRRRLARRLVRDWRQKSGLTVEEIYTKEKRLAYAERVHADLHLKESDVAPKDAPAEE